MTYQVYKWTWYGVVLIAECNEAGKQYYPGHIFVEIKRGN